MLSGLRSKIRLHFRYVSEAFHFWRLTVKYNATNNTDSDIQKMQYTLSRETHTLEKGMSMRKPRKGFGQQKANNLLDRLFIYNERYGNIDKDFLQYPISTLCKYVNFVKSDGTDVSHLESKIDKLKSEVQITFDDVKAGIVQEEKSHILSLCDKNFESLLYSRHSIRYFSEELVPQKTIEKALELAQRTPSACNRQGWLTHVYRADKSVELIRWQGGSRGFEDEIRCSILVTANLKAFLSHEVHQAYIDGGLYAMNLINALHSLGLGTIPLSCGFNYPQLKKLSTFGIPKYEVPILIIGVGVLPDKFNVAVSDRKKVNKTNTYHE